MSGLDDLVREWVAAEHAADEARAWADRLKEQIRSHVLEEVAS